MHNKLFCLVVPGNFAQPFYKSHAIFHGACLLFFYLRSPGENSVVKGDESAKSRNLNYRHL